MYYNKRLRLAKKTSQITILQLVKHRTFSSRAWVAKTCASKCAACSLSFPAYGIHIYTCTDRDHSLHLYFDIKKYLFSSNWLNSSYELKKLDRSVYFVRIRLMLERYQRRTWKNTRTSPSSVICLMIRRCY